MRATHLALEVHGLDVPRGMMVLHACHNPPCVNPRHLRVGTNKDNMRDMVAAGRSLVGERSSVARLRDVDVENIRALGMGNRHLSQKDPRRFTASRLARMYGVSNQLTSMILSGAHR